MSNLVSKLFNIHNEYSTIVGATQPVWDGIAHSIQKISSSIWNSTPTQKASKLIVRTINQSKFVQNSLQRVVNLLMSKNPFSFQIKVHLLNQDPKIKRLKDKINELENSIQTSYYKVFRKPILLEKSDFSMGDYRVITSHFQKFLSENNHVEHTDSSLTVYYTEDLIDFLQNDTIPDSQLIKEQVITSIENLSFSLTKPSDSLENETIIEAKQGFQKCYFLFLSKQLLRKFEKGEVYKDDLLLFLKNYKTSPIIRLLNDATLENVTEAFAGTIGEIITQSSLAASFHREVDKRILGPILSISPFHSLLGRFSSYLGITLASYIGIKVMGSEEPLKDYVHNMTWATIASLISEYGLEMTEISNPASTFLIPLIASSIAYNFSSLYQPLLKREYLAQTISENYTFINKTENLVDNSCITVVKEVVKDNINNISDFTLDYFIQSQIFSLDPKLLDNALLVSSILAFKHLLLQSVDIKQTEEISNTIVKKALTVFFKEFSNFYSYLMKNETLLRDFYTKRLEIIEASRNLSENSDINSMPDTKDIILKLVCAINPLQKNSLFLPLLFTKVDELLPIFLFQSLCKNLEKSLKDKLSLFPEVDPLFLEVIVKSFIINTILEKKSLFTEILYADVLVLENTLKLIDSLIHLTLISQYDKKDQSSFRNLVYKVIHQEMNTAIELTPQIMEQSA